VRPRAPKIAAEPRLTGRFTKGIYSRNEPDKGPLFGIAVPLSDPVDDQWLSILDDLVAGEAMLTWDEDETDSGATTLHVWAAAQDVTPVLDQLAASIDNTNEIYASVLSLEPSMDAELNLWWQRRSQ